MSLQFTTAIRALGWGVEGESVQEIERRLAEFHSRLETRGAMYWDTDEPVGADQVRIGIGRERPGPFGLTVGRAADGTVTFRRPVALGRHTWVSAFSPGGQDEEGVIFSCSTPELDGAIYFRPMFVYPARGRGDSTLVVVAVVGVGAKVQCMARDEAPTLSALTPMFIRAGDESLPLELHDAVGEIVEVEPLANPITRRPVLRLRLSHREYGCLDYFADQQLVEGEAQVGRWAYGGFLMEGVVYGPAPLWDPPRRPDRLIRA